MGNPRDTSDGHHSDNERNTTRTRTRRTLSPVPISDPEEKRRQRNLKSYSQPLGRDAIKNKQQSLEFSSSSSSTRSYSYPHYQSPNSRPAAEDRSNALPEFTGSGGSTGIFKLPVWAPMQPGRPPPLELRPHPLRETQVGCSLRTIACTRTQLWAGQECGVRYWELDDVFGGDKVRKSGDEESAPFQESCRTSPTLCLVVDERRGLVWTGHKDGKIRSWRMEREAGEGDLMGSNFKEGLSWHVQRCSVLSLVVTSSGN